MICVLLVSAFPVLAVDELAFLVTADPHFGYRSDESLNVANIQAMNTVGASASSTPRGVLLAGDTTHDGTQSQWNTFQYHYPLSGGMGSEQVHYPVYECTGNHDREEISGDDSVPVDGVISRHGSLLYSWDWEGVHFVSLDLYPTQENSAWLENHLANSVSQPDTPIVIMSHYGYDEIYSRSWWGNWNSQSAAFLDVIDGYNIIALIHGHIHGSFHYVWEGYDVYTPGSPKVEGEKNSFGLVAIEDDVFTWTEYFWTLEGEISVDWTDQKTIVSPEPMTINLLGVGLLVLSRKKGAKH
ncbi:MAG: hypothetical protein JXA11_01285 [Phycisphaerae bacterium]|nr:hypothetical protein [Phycisphaerae bacterium]